MDKKEFLKWLEENEIEMEYDNCGGYPSDTMVFSKNNKWFLNVRCSTKTNFFNVKEAIVLEFMDVDPDAMDDVVTISEVAEKLNKDTSTLRKAIDKNLNNGTLKIIDDCRRANQIWLLKRIAVKKMYPNLDWNLILSI